MKKRQCIKGNNKTGKYIVIDNEKCYDYNDYSLLRDVRYVVFKYKESMEKYLLHYGFELKEYYTIWEANEITKFLKEKYESKDIEGLFVEDIYHVFNVDYIFNDFNCEVIDIDYNYASSVKAKGIDALVIVKKGVPFTIDVDHITDLQASSNHRKYFKKYIFDGVTIKELKNQGVSSSFFFK